MQLSVLEIMTWYEWFKLQNDRNKETLSGNTANRNPRRR